MKLKTLFLFVFVLVLLSGCTGLNEPSQIKAPYVDLIERGTNEWLETSSIDKPIIYSFWASWCGYCNEEIPALDDLYAEYQDRVEFISVNITYQDSLSGVNTFVDRHNIQMPIYLDLDSASSLALGVQSVPTVIIVDQDGYIVDRRLGATMNPTELYREKLDNLFNNLN